MSLLFSIRDCTWCIPQRSALYAPIYLRQEPISFNTNAKAFCIHGYICLVDGILPLPGLAPFVLLPDGLQKFLVVGVATLRLTAGWAAVIILGRRLRGRGFGWRNSVQINDARIAPANNIIKANQATADNLINWIYWQRLEMGSLFWRSLLTFVPWDNWHSL